MTSSVATYVGVQIKGVGDPAYDAIKNAVVGTFREIPMNDDTEVMGGVGAGDSPDAPFFVVDTQNPNATAELAALAPSVGSAIVGLSGDIDQATRVAAALTHSFDCILEEPTPGRTIMLTVDPATRPAWLHETG